MSAGLGGRNAVHLAQLGYDVTAVDLSTVGLAKAERLAASRGVRIATVHADLAAYDCIIWADVGSFGVNDVRRLDGHVRRYAHNRRIVLDDHVRLPGRFFGRLTASVQAAL